MPDSTSSDLIKVIITGKEWIFALDGRCCGAPKGTEYRYGKVKDPDNVLNDVEYGFFAGILAYFDDEEGDTVYWLDVRGGYHVTLADDRRELLLRIAGQQEAASICEGIVYPTQLTYEELSTEKYKKMVDQRFLRPPVK
ncbi:hypothetical protein HON52_04335 [Candidatus Uhrbacteria bacterium]|nr:hypothetical protein [Candidatus Uhrbacteria bacterium]